MTNITKVEDMGREQLLELVHMYAKDWIAIDGLWFQSIEAKYGMDEAMAHDEAAWAQFTVIEGKRIKAFLGLPEQAGLEGLAQVLEIRPNARLNRGEIEFIDGTLVYRVVDCCVQSARKRKGMALHPCKSVGLIEYAGLARTVDARIETECVSCHPDVTDEACACVWRFTIRP